MGAVSDIVLKALAAKIPATLITFALLLSRTNVADAWLNYLVSSMPATVTDVLIHCELTQITESAMVEAASRLAKTLTSTSCAAPVTGRMHATERVLVRCRPLSATSHTFEDF